MYLETLALKHVRNLADQEISFCPGFNYLYGPNGAGKTAVLEAIYLLARGRSFRSHRTTPVIHRNTEELIVRVEVVQPSGTTTRLAVSKSRQGLTQMRRDGEPVRRASELARFLPVHTLLPNAADLLYGSPTIRRSFLDWGLFHVKPSFVDVSKEYRRVLAQRNTWLKSLDSNEDIDVLIDPWFEQYSTKAMQISEARQSYVADLSPYFEEILAKLAPGLDISLAYDWGGLADSSQANKKMSESWLRDVKLGATQRGPHRGDLRFSREGELVSGEASRGQAKLIASAAVLAQAKHLIDAENTNSIFLIDDFGAELDQVHWRKFLETLLGMDCQVIATSTEPLDESQEWVKLLADLKVFHVEQGQINVASPTYIGNEPQ